jgi:hypothetical protein
MEICKQILMASALLASVIGPPVQAQEGAKAVVPPNLADGHGCLAVGPITEDNGTVNVSLRNGCGRAIAMLAVRPAAPDLPVQAPISVDFTIGIGLPESWAARLPPGSPSVGTFAPGSLRDINFAVSGHAAALEIRVEGVIYETGETGGYVASLRPIQSAWQHRLDELETLSAHVLSLRANHLDALDATTYVEERIATIHARMASPKLNTEEATQLSERELELQMYQRLARQLGAAVANGQLTRSEAQGYLQEALDNRTLAHRKLVATFSKQEIK